MQDNGASADADRAGVPSGSSHSSVSRPEALIPCAEMEAHREAFQACWRAAVSAAYAKQVLRGWTIEKMAKRVGWTDAKMRRLLLVPRNLISIATLAELCWSMNCEPDMRMANGRTLISVTPVEDIIAASAGETRRAETPKSGSVEDEHAVPKADAQQEPSHPSPTGRAAGGEGEMK